MTFLPDRHRDRRAGHPNLTRLACAILIDVVSLSVAASNKTSPPPYWRALAPGLCRSAASLAALVSCHTSIAPRQFGLPACFANTNRTRLKITPGVGDDHRRGQKTASPKSMLFLLLSKIRCHLSFYWPAWLNGCDQARVDRAQRSTQHRARNQPASRKTDIARWPVYLRAGAVIDPQVAAAHCGRLPRARHQGVRTSGHAAFASRWPMHPRSIATAGACSIAKGTCPRTAWSTSHGRTCGTKSARAT
jgi:hypothetical protein